jgi:DNA-binding beta-propeller fold protein YncE
MEICQGPTHLAQPTDGQGNPLFGVPMLFITCFDSGELYVVDPSVPQIRSIIPVGREPINTVFDPNDPTRAYVMGFGANNVSVVDLDPLSPTHDRVIQRIGFPSPVPREVGPQ